MKTSFCFLLVANRFTPFFHRNCNSSGCSVQAGGEPSLDSMLALTILYINKIELCSHNAFSVTPSAPVIKDQRNLNPTAQAGENLNTSGLALTAQLTTHTFCTNTCQNH